ncbi:unnamed protein product [Candidula unifasciata]|uniref:Peroxisomal bifunctional enzyme n=1 Tax=Candidula unifasciata TaxID=100452 RepID=A0A8S3Z973_9EUPU|nr:unnamed protein product [Candidula unifasciata]
MVDYIVDGNIAVLEINNPPVNALSIHVREGLLTGIQKANQDGSVQAIVIIGKGSTFPSGADIREFGKPPKEPWLTAVGEAIEASEKPVISALHGTALGGGLEVALFSHYRIADERSRVGFPEVKLGLLPGAQGTIRLPRLTGLAVAMRIITSGDHINAPEALKYGILDKLISGNLLQEAKTFAKSVIGKPLDNRRLSKIAVRDAATVDKHFDEALAEVKRKYKGMIAPVNCLKSIRGSAKLPFVEAARLEAALFRELLTSAQSAALRYSFFADRSAPRWKLPSGASIENTKPDIIKSVAVIGAGTMGSAIAICFIRVGIPVLLVEQNDKLLQNALKNIGQILQGSVKLNRITADQRKQSLQILRGETSLDIVSDVDLVVEAVFENLKLKQEIFARLDKICKPSALLCSNTSTLDIDKIAVATNRPGKVAGMHFFAPAHIMKLLENVYGTHTSPSTVATIMDIGKRIGKVSVLVRTCDGFVANRMNRMVGNEAVFMLEEGALPQDVDRVLEDFGMAMGPFRVTDLSGSDVGWRIRQERAKEQGIQLTYETRFVNGERYSSLPDRLYELGRYGQKTGKGWYRYEKPFARTAYPDPEITDVINSHCRSLGIERRVIPPQEIIERCLFAAINEGFKVLEEGVAEKPENIDIIWQYGLGFPRYRGGPMFYASQVGLKTIYERVCYYYDAFPHSSYWAPSDLLRKLASHSTEVPIDQWTSKERSRL